jgi:predicted RNA-binding Zn ribbon-like protein
VIDAPVLVALANAGRPRRPTGARQAVAEDPFERAESATRMLKPVLGRSVDAGELDGLRHLAREAGTIAASVVDGMTPSPRGLNRLAAGCTGRVQLRSTPTGRLEAVVQWDAGPAAAVLARRIVEELGEIEPGRLRRCARPECGLFFYDSTRPGTQRWHSEVPCGWRERQRRRRAQ